MAAVAASRQDPPGVHPPPQGPADGHPGEEPAVAEQDGDTNHYHHHNHINHHNLNHYNDNHYNNHNDN
jgi:hypothetical protein